MKRIAKFHKVSLPQFLADWTETFGGTEDEARAYMEALLPTLDRWKGAASD